ncbi:MAG TPA: DUF1761 domain-containing protein [Cyclobacteriaceae bacterium]|nr:DUF1761 domain-containing protein [Cyclobacteriaceae bacterium]
MNSSVQTRMNYWAVSATGILAFALSLLWYSPLMFGKIWMQYRHAPNPSTPQWTIAFAPLREVLASYVVAVLIVRLGLSDWKASARLMVILWAAFHAVGMAGAILWDNMQWQLGVVHAGDWLVKLVFIGIVLTMWMRQR